MREPKPREWYDDALADPASPHRLANPETPWQPLYVAVANLVRSMPAPKVNDIGCGTGRLAALLDPLRHTTASYTGLDFSTTALRESRRYTNAASHGRTKCRFEYCNLDDEHDRRRFLNEPDAVYLLIEVLEHLAHDLDLLYSLPVGARTIISVPSTDSESHVRHFPAITDALERYRGPVEIETWQRIWTPERRGYWHLLTGTIAADEQAGLA